MVKENRRMLWFRCVGQVIADAFGLKLSDEGNYVTLRAKGDSRTSRFKKSFASIAIRGGGNSFVWFVAEKNSFDTTYMDWLNNGIKKGGELICFKNGMMSIVGILPPFSSVQELKMKLLLGGIEYA